MLVVVVVVVCHVVVEHAHVHSVALEPEVVLSVEHNHVHMMRRRNQHDEVNMKKSCVNCHMNRMKLDNSENLKHNFICENHFAR